MVWSAVRFLLPVAAVPPLWNCPPAQQVTTAPDPGVSHQAYGEGFEVSYLAGKKTRVSVSWVAARQMPATVVVSTAGGSESHRGPRWT